MIEAIDLIAQLNKTEFKAKLALDKWSEKVSVQLEVVYTALIYMHVYLLYIHVSYCIYT
jgi:hypothetical protein